MAGLKRVSLVAAKDAAIPKQIENAYSGHL